MGKTSKRAGGILHTIGNLLMGLSMVFVLITFFPIIKEEIRFRTTNVFAEKPVNEDFSIRIPSLGINAPVTANVDPWKQNQYLPALRSGVAHASGSALPSGKGTVFLFAHSSDLPWRMTQYNTAFFRLGRINDGDEVIVTYKGQDYTYHVREKKIVWPSEVKYITHQDKDQLILQTCVPIGTALKRLLVFADPG